MKKILISTLLLFLIFTIPVTAEQPTEEQYQINVIDKSIKAAVSLSNLVDGASGFYVAPNYILTNEHVVAAMPKPVVYTRFGACFDNEIVATNKVKDLALIKTGCKSDDYITLADKVTQGQDSYIIGDPSKIGIMALSGIVTMIKDDKTARGIFVDASVHPGSSGSALVNSDGRLIGVVVGRNERATSLAVAIHLTDVKAFLERNGIK
ncbi:hypothetical protein BK133_00775 [Paenibacillus sp. FSL H8-0548]|uniref:S1 family peptidase n=1 Tax=Paenibacillus sp. FSL H8-0548 TaxID=1920422 RepID=UPI00096E7F2C|nr:serine protease [Paenibacillus sp. FSL H8-0548]OMF38770.1 hypothetical protein BK133_00775 [Paenibacillus sp. FSL H8-0548]